MDWRKTFIAWASALLLLAPIAASAGEWQTYLKDDFSSAQTMFYTGPLGTAYYGIDEAGRYIVDGLSAPGDSMAILTDSLYYYYFEGEGEVIDTLAGDLASFGLVFHYNKRVRAGQNSYYVFYIYADGYYGVKRVLGDSDGNVDILIPLAKSAMIDPNYPNVLAVDAQGSRFDLYINGKYVDGFTDLTIDGGGFGFYSTKKTKAAFDNFSVKIERREMGRDNLAQPAVTQSGEADPSGFSFQGYSPPVIQRDPSRPLYPWEVGYVDPKDDEAPPVDPVETPVEPDPEPKPEHKHKAKPEPEPESKPVTTGRNTDAGSAQAKVGNEPSQEVKILTANDSPQVSKPKPVQPVSDQAKPNKVQTHSYGEFGYDENSSEVKIVSADKLNDPEPLGEFQQPFDKASDSKKPASIKDVGVAPAKAPQIDIRPDWLKDTQKTESPIAGSEGEELKETLPLTPEVASNQNNGEPRVEDTKPTAETKPVPAESKPAPKRRRGIGGNDDWWDDDSTPAKPEPVKQIEQPKPELQPVVFQESKPQPPVNEIDASIPISREVSSSGKGDPSETDITENTPDAPAKLSLFPTKDEIAKLEETITPEIVTKEPVKPVVETAEEPPVQGFSFREAEQTGAGSPAIETQVLITSEADRQAKAKPAPAAPKVVPPVPEVQARRDEENAELSLLYPEPADDEQIERPIAQPQITIIDDFSDQTWPVADNGVSSYRYFGAAYEIDNRMADTMAISFQQNELASAQYSVETEFIDGISEVGYGLAAQFQVNGGNASYYGLFISHSGEYLLLKVLGGEEKVLVDWTPCNLLKPNTPNTISLEINSPAIKVFINNKLVTTKLDSSLRAGGYALLAGPGVAARFDNLVINGDPAH